MTVWTIVLAWAVLSVPLALLLGAVIARADRAASIDHAVMSFARELPSVLSITG